MPKEFKCERCQSELDFDEVGYLGARDPKDTSCTPFTSLLCLCFKCADADPKYNRSPMPPEK